MTDYSPFTGKRPRPPTLRPQRTLWTMQHAAYQPLTATIYNVASGRELRVFQGDEDNLRTSVLSRTNDAPLEARAEELRRMLLTRGWTHSR